MALTSIGRENVCFSVISVNWFSNAFCHLSSQFSMDNLTKTVLRHGRSSFICRNVFFMDGFRKVISFVAGAIGELGCPSRDLGMVPKRGLVRRKSSVERQLYVS